MKKGLFSLVILVMAFGNMGFAQNEASLKSESTANVLKHYGVRDETTMVPQMAEFTVLGLPNRTVYNYDEDFYLTDELGQILIGDEWVDLGLVTYEYDFSGNVLEKLILVMGESGWENLQFTSYAYENDQLNEVITQEWENGQWVNVTKEVYNYDDEVVTVLYWEWNGNNWTSNSLYTYTYSVGSINLLIQYMAGGAWQNLEKRVYTLDFDEHVTEILVERWDDPEWEKDEMSVYDYVDGVYNTKKVLTWDGENWADEAVFGFEYENGNAVHGTCRVKENDSWVESDGNIEMAYGYSAANKTIFASEVTMTYVDLTNVDENAQAANVKVYPVPAENEVFVQADGFQKAEIYSVTGQKMMESQQNNMNVSQLSSGLYIIKVYDLEGNCATQRFVVK